MYYRLQDGVEMWETHIKHKDGTREVHPYFKNTEGKEFRMPRRVYDVIEKADGTHKISCEGVSQDKLNRYLRYLEREGILTKRRFVFEGLTNTFILHMFSEKTSKWQKPCAVWSSLLPWLSLGFILGSIVMNFFCYNDDFWTGGFYYPIIIALVVLGILMHEFGHLAAAIAYGDKVSDMPCHSFGCSGVLHCNICVNDN